MTQTKRKTSLIQNPETKHIQLPTSHVVHLGAILANDKEIDEIYKRINNEEPDAAINIKAPIGRSFSPYGQQSNF